ncbi:Aldo/keto reductase [Mytilinidion resinicola]|uniref:Aldo/keto reductase n=1 Tax=Mytilinidion resinicola TaxID=574789 RepID=A0A6A6YYK3_9PEZI|nr:Aldo/keto reductase [Mytilinidion resinicola]KAF2813005.1 Aldo/keto reductase [Mytilinidion resinicola]
MGSYYHKHIIILNPKVKTLHYDCHNELNTGAEIPVVGFGTWQAAPGEAGRAVKIAMKSGYKHLLWSSQHSQVEASLRRSLADLQLDYVDLYLMHWPISLPPNEATAANFRKEDRTTHALDWDFTNTWTDMEKLLGTGLTKAIGVANFSTVNLEKLLKTAKVVPAEPQNPLNSHPVVLEIAEKRKRSAAQVMLSWGVARGWSVIPKRATEDRIKSNLAVFELSAEEVAKLDQLAKTQGRRFNRPNWGTTVFHDDDESVV